MNQETRGNDTRNTSEKDLNTSWWVVLSTPRENTNGNEPQKRKKKRDWPNLSEWLMVIFTGVIAFYAYSQYTEMHGATDYARRQTEAAEKIQAAADRQAIAASNFAASANNLEGTINSAEKDLKQTAANSERSIKATQDAIRLEQRAWVTIDSQRLKTLEQDKIASAEIEIVNAGKTIAKGGDSRSYILLPATKLIQYEPFGTQKKPISLGVMFPNSHYFLVTSTDDKLTDMQVREVQNGSRFLYVWGDLNYTDVFGIKHHSNFCGFYDPPTHRFNLCDGYPYDAN